MAAGYDGSIRIDTSIDSKGFNTGVNGIMNSLKGIAAAVGIAFGVTAIVRFIKSCADAASALQIMENRFRGVFGETTDYAISQLTELSKKINMATDDLMSLAATLQNTFVALGFGGMQAADLSLKLTKLTEDLATFYGQTDVEMAQTLVMALQGMTRGLKALGISINEADIKNKALNLGIYSGTGAVSEQARAQAILALIIDKTSAAQGNAEKTAHTWAGEMRGLTGAWDEFKHTLGGAVVIFAPVIAAITAVIKWLTVLAQYFAMVVGALFGIKINVGGVAADTGAAAGAAGDLSDNMGSAADNTAAAGKAAKGALAAFDELNVLQQEQGAGGGVGPPGGGIVVPPIDMKFKLKDPFAEMRANVAKFVEELKKFFAPLEAPLERLKKAALELGGTIWEGLKWVWINILKPFGEWLIQNVAPIFIDILANTLDILNKVLIALQPSLNWLWVNILQPLAKWTGEQIIKALEWLRDRLHDISEWIDAHPDEFQNIVNSLAILVGVFILANILIGIWNVLMGVGAVVTGVFAGIMTFLSSPIVMVAGAILLLILIIKLLIDHWPQISEAAGKAWQAIKDFFGKAGEWFQTSVIDPIKKGWDNFWLNFNEGASSAWEGFKGLAKTAINVVIGLINGMIAGFLGGINSVIGAINGIKFTIPNWVPVIGGKSVGFSIAPVAVPQIPLLATGAVIPPNAAFAAILGEQRAGKNIEAPEALIRQIVAEEIGKSQGNQQITINFAGSLGALIRELKPYIDKENVRIGNSLIHGVTG